MNNASIDDIVRRAIAVGWLPADAQPAMQGTARPWPVMLLTGFGAWLAALPLLGLLALLLGDALQHGPAAYVLGLMAITGAVALLRAATLPLLVEQAAVPLLLAGVALLGFKLADDFSATEAAAILAVLQLTLALLLPRAWLRVLLGAAAAGALCFALGHEGLFRFESDPWAVTWWNLQALMLVWAAAIALQRRIEDGRRAVHAAALEAIACGWLLALLACLAALSGTSFLVGAASGSGGGIGGGSAVASARLPGLVSATFAVVGLVWAARAWPTLRRAEPLAAAAVLAGLAAVMPSLGACLFALAATATTGRRHRAAAAALASAWIVGGFYYRLEWPLATKALWLVAAAALLGLLAVSAARRQAVAAAPVSERPPASRRLHAALFTGAAVAATLAAVNVGIHQKEQLIAHGQPLYVALAPVDPRSLMQGDYMRLNFSLPQDVRNDRSGLLGAAAPQLRLQRDARNVGTALGLDAPERPLAPDELRVRMTPKNGQWVLVTDAWFFKEGEAERYAMARYGEFRVDAQGRALLVGLADEALRPLR